jgi:hypothetical protein
MNETKQNYTIHQILHINKYDVNVLNKITRTISTQTQNEIKTKADNRPNSRSLEDKQH